MAKRVTIQDVAQRAGVSYQTVSRVLNNMPDVANQTRERVKQVIEELNYQPSSVARSLVSRRTHTLGLVATNFDQYFYTQLAAGAEKEARQLGYVFILWVIDPATIDEEESWRILTERQVDGIFVASTNRDHHSYIERLLRHGMPVIALGYPPQKQLVTINVDNEGGGYQATRHLLERGHHCIGTIASPHGSERTDGYRRALAESGIDFDPDLLVPGDWSYQSGYAAMQQLMARRPAMTAVFAQNDQMAIGAIHAVRHVHKRVPRDYAIVGFDDIPAAAYACPPLTTVRQPMQEVGRIATRVLVERVRNPAQERKEISLNTELIRRESS